MRYLKKAVIAASAFVCTMMLSPSWSGQGGVSLSIGKADAQTRIYVRGPGLPWYAVRAYYWDGPWTGPGYTYASWNDYAKRNGIGCTPGSAITGQDGIRYRCQ